jgi:voltage-gated potassium channel
VIHDKAGERILERSLQEVQQILPPGQRLNIYKNNSDGKGNSYGCHENYLIDRQIPFARIVHDLTPFFVTRQIICGAGRVGRSAARELARRPVPFVIIEQNEAKMQRYANENWLMMTGDATQEPTLRDAQIDRARGLVAATTTDATNLYIVLTARGLNARLKIIARASEEDAEKHLLTAGADSVVSPYAFAGQRIAQAFLRPHVLSFLDTATTHLGVDLEIGEIYVSPSSAFAGQTIESSRIRQDRGIIILAIKRENGMRFNLAPEDRIQPGDFLIAMGEPAQLRQLEQTAVRS